MSGEGAVLGLLVLVALTPVVAAGGAIYGASVADSAADVKAHLATLDEVYATTSATYARTLEHGFAGLTHLDSVVGAAPAEFDSRLEIQFDALSGDGGGAQSELRFTLSTRTRLFIGDQVEPVYVRDYRFHTPVRRLSSWAADNGSALRTAVDGLAASTVQALLDDHFRQSPYRVHADYPAFRSIFRPGRLKSDRPQFRWHVAEGGTEIEPDTRMRYELQISSTEGHFSQFNDITGRRFAPAEPLPPCVRMRWVVRGHYESMGQPRQTAWSRPREFRTPCPQR